jgi:hypothetical protein
MKKVEKHFVTFFSPGTFFSELTEKSIKSWDVALAKRMVNNIIERYGATPYGFQFNTRSRGPKDLDSKVIKTSPMYYLGGKVETIEMVALRNDPKERMLLSNMRGNGWDKIIINDNSWRITLPLQKDDIILKFTPKKRLKFKKETSK